MVILADVFSKNMGYLENMLPRFLAREGVEVHVIATDLPPYHWTREFKDTYGGFAERLPVGLIEEYDGYTLHILGHKDIFGYMRMVGLGRKLRFLRPDVVQISAAIGWSAIDAAAYRIVFGYKLFTGNHTTASVFPLAKKGGPWWDKEHLRCRLMRTFPGFLASLVTEKCYGATIDCAEIAVRFFGVQKKKIAVSFLGVDTELFRPISGESEYLQRLDLRKRLGFSESDIVCIYTGRFSEDKNPLLLAQAIAALGEMGLPFRGLFVGNGVQAKAISSLAGCVIHPFVPVSKLPDFFRAAEIGVWPTQESMSMLDAAACGLPIVVNDTLVAVERVQGNGFQYKLNDIQDLIRVLLDLRDPQTRNHLGSIGAQKVRRDFSWESLARERLRDYLAAITPKSKHAEDVSEVESDHAL